MYFVPLCLPFSGFHEGVLDAIRDGVDFGGVATLGKHVAHESGRYVNVTHLIIYIAPPRAIEELVEPFYFAHADGRSHVFRLDVEGGSNRFADAVAVLDGFPGDTERYEDVYYVRPIAGCVYQVFIVVGKAEIMLVHQRLENRHMEFSDVEVTALSFFRAIPT